jgi:hypothetical protein
MCELLDRFHIDERIAEVCELITHRQPAARKLRDSWTYLDRSDTAIVRITRRIDELLHNILLGASTTILDLHSGKHERGRGCRQKVSGSSADTSNTFAATGIRR